MQIKYVLSALMLIAILSSQISVETDSLAADAPAPELATGLISNDRFLFAPDVLSFDIQSFLNSQPGPLKTYQERVNGESWTAAEIIRFNAIYFGINPQVLLVMLEATENTITQSDAVVFARSPADTSDMTGFYAHVNRLANSALSAYDAHRYGLAGAKIILQDGSSAEVLAGSSGTYAIQSLLAESLPHDQWQAWTQGSAAKFSAIFTEWFGSPLATSTTAVVPDALPGGYGLPFPVGETWYYTGGPHHYCGWGYQSCTNPQAGGRP